MKRIQCEMCGSSDLLKEDGVFKCQNCGCSYSLEEARKMMVDGEVTVTGRVKIDESDKIHNFYMLAEEAYDANDDKKAISYCDKIIEIDASYYQAWLLKGKINFDPDNEKNSNSDVAFSCFDKAIKFAGDNASAVKQTICKFFDDYFSGLSDVRCIEAATSLSDKVDFFDHIEKIGLNDDIDRQKICGYLINVFEADDIYNTFRFDGADSLICNNKDEILDFAHNITDIMDSDLCSFLNHKIMTDAVLEWASRHLDDLYQTIAVLVNKYYNDMRSTQDERLSCILSLEAIFVILDYIEPTIFPNRFNSAAKKFEKSAYLLGDLRWNVSFQTHDFQREKVQEWHSWAQTLKEKCIDIPAPQESEQQGQSYRQNAGDDTTQTERSDDDDTTETDDDEEDEDVENEETEEEQENETTKSENNGTSHFWTIVISVIAIFIVFQVLRYHHRTQVVEWLSLSRLQNTVEVGDTVKITATWHGGFVSCKKLTEEILKINTVHIGSLSCDDDTQRDTASADIMFIASAVGKIPLSLTLNNTSDTTEITVIDTKSFIQNLYDGNLEKVKSMYAEGFYSLENEKINLRTVALKHLDKNPDMLLWLLDNGLDVNLYTDSGVTLLMNAVIHNKTELFDKLMASNKIDINLTDKKGRTALMFAAIKGRDDMAKKLIEAQADIFIGDDNKKTAYKYAQMAKNKKIADMLGTDSVEVIIFSDYCHACQQKTEEYKKELKKYPTAKVKVVNKNEIYDYIDKENKIYGGLVIHVCQKGAEYCYFNYAGNLKNLSSIMGRHS